METEKDDLSMGLDFQTVHEGKNPERKEKKMKTKRCRAGHAPSKYEWTAAPSSCNFWLVSTHPMEEWRRRMDAAEPSQEISSLVNY